MENLSIHNRIGDDYRKMYLKVRNYSQNVLNIIVVSRVPSACLIFYTQKCHKENKSGMTQGPSSDVVDLD